MVETKLAKLSSAISSAPLNLVSRGDRERVRELHVAEALAVLDSLAVPEGSHVLDLGSGGGLPGLVFAIQRPDLQITCLDARTKKCAFVSGVSEDLDLSNVTAVPGRAETLAHTMRFREGFHLVVSRAVARASVVAELSRGFVADGGSIAMIKGPSYTEEMPGLAKVSSSLALAPPRARSVDRAPRPTWIVQAEVVGSAPPWVPRPDGQPAGRPLESSEDQP